MNEESPGPAPGAPASGARRAATGRRARRGAPACAAALVALLVSLVVPSVAWADEEESTQSAVLVEQALALIANDAGDERVAERVEDALQAPEKQGVNLDLVERAGDLIADPGESAAATRQAQTLLLDSVGAKLPSAPQGGRFATGEETGTSEILDELRPPRGISDSGDAALFALGLASVAVGLWLSHRLRPPHRLRELEHRRTRKERP
ncbi:MULTISPECIES: hypothetical protein [Streptomyces]|uniref:hypothetical protein n=1 Tax=Streptomyces TaxID=1883 RepID=UPI00345F6544